MAARHAQWRQVETHATAIRAEVTQDRSSCTYLTGEELLRQICVRMRVRSFDDLNLGAPRMFAPIRQVLDLEHDLWEFVGLYVSLRAISTAHDAEIDFLAKHRVSTFSALGIGNTFAAAPAVVYHFNLPVATAVLPLTLKAVLTHLGEFRYLNQRHQDTGAFLAFVATKLAVPRGTVLGIHVQNLQRSMDLMRRIQTEERKQINDIENDFRRDVAHTVFQLTKEKFSSENRELAVAAALASSKLDLPRGEQKANVSVKLESDVLNRVTVLDAHLDHLIGRYAHRLPKDTSHVISKQDLKLRAQICHKKHERSRSTVVTWVLCSIIAKSRALLDAKLSPEGQPQNRSDNKVAEDDEEECQCCCVGKPACTCSCTCTCHAVDSDSNDDDESLVNTTSPNEGRDQAPSTNIDMDTAVRDLWAATQQAHPDMSMFEVLEAVERAAPKTATSHRSLVQVLTSLDRDLPLVVPHTSASVGLSSEQVNALWYQCRLVQNEFDHPESPSEGLQSLVHHALSVEDGRNHRHGTLKTSLTTAPYFSLYFTSPLTASVPPSNSMAVTALLEWIEAVPCLVDVEAAVQWQVHDHGPFVQFFITNFPHVPLLQLPSKQCVKLEPNATLAALAAVPTPAQPHTVATVYTSAFVQEHGRWNWNNVHQALESFVSSLCRNDVPPFVLRVVHFIPVELWRPLVPPLIKALAKAVPHPHQALALAAANDVADRSLLFRLGIALNISSWNSLATTRIPDMASISNDKGSSQPLSNACRLSEAVQPSVAAEDTTRRGTVPSKQSAAHSAEPVEVVPSTDACRALIHDIRKHSFGIGLPATIETQAFLRLQQNRLERALQRLSAELYSTSTHFVLELLQNADDNVYDHSVAPCAEFVVREDAISFFCNESGFQPAHIRALCDVGASTKTMGMIGQKGIGFKSVFAVSDCPEIHSNGYHVRFDARSTPDNVRFILPHWIESPAAEYSNQPGTWFHLPMRDMSSTAAVAMLDSMEPSMLLFLNQLMSLTIQNRVAKTQVHYRKQWVAEERVQLHTNTHDVQAWHVHRREVAVPEAFAPRKGTTTRLELAFPLTHDESALCNQPVFAYLPVQTYGFKCIVQANFDLPSSREAILDNDWNQFLLAQFPTVFVDELVKLLPEFPHLIRMVPVDIAPPFHTMAHAVCRQLQDLPIIQTSSGQYVPPRHVVDQVETDPISDAFLWRHCRKHFIDPAFSQLMPPQLKRILGILPWNASHVVQLGRSLAEPNDAPAPTLMWLAAFMDLVATMNPMAAQLRPLHLFPVKIHPGSHDDVMAPQYALKSLEHSLFCPLDTAAADVPFADELNILHPDYMHALAPKTTRFLSVLGIKQLTTHDILQFHLLPLVSTKLDVSDHLKALRFCMHVHVEKPLPASLLGFVRRSIQAVTSKGDLVPLTSSDIFLEPAEFASPALLNHVTVVPYTSVATFSFLHACGVPVLLSLHHQPNANTIPGLSSVVASIAAASDVAAATSLMQYLDRHWTAQHSSTFAPTELQVLRAARWLPSSTLTSATTEGQLRRPHETYLNVPAGLKAFFPSPALLNHEFATALAVKFGLDVPDYLHLLQLDNVVHDTVVDCLLELKALATGQPDVLKGIQSVLSETPVLSVNNKRVRLTQTIWKPASACPDLVGLRPTFPKSLKSFFLQLGVPAKPSVAVAVATLQSMDVPDDQLPYLKYLADQPMDAMPREVSAIPFLTSTSGRKVAFDSDPLLADNEPSWWPLLMPEHSRPLVVTSHPDNTAFAGFWQFGITLVQDVRVNPQTWNTLLDNAMMQAEPGARAAVVQFLCFLLDTWSSPSGITISHLPTQRGTFEPFATVFATATTKIRHPQVVDVPVRYHDILAKVWGLARLPVKTSVLFDSAVDDADLRDQLATTLFAVAAHFKYSHAAHEVDALGTFMDSMQCWKTENLRVEYETSSTPHDSTAGQRVTESRPVVLHECKNLYVSTPVDFALVVVTVASAMWTPLVANDVASYIDGSQHRQHPMLAPDSLKRQLFPIDLPLAKRPRPDLRHAHDADRFRPNLLTDQAKVAIGRVGEEYVYSLLRAEFPPDQVEWVNQVEETGLPYDICIHHASGGTEFIEVKSTSTYDKVVFEMSVQELEYATLKGSQYSIYRAFAIKPHGALHDSRVVRLRNPMTLLRHKKLQLSVVMTEEACNL
ncbi:hypothetical protein H310_03690 [Aphanomyces invadans]|uniref:Uncharacterized protein n=1 Tax=Aphanomyces invadans TaxID=157072 RepID=A0A024UI28_9STRA|nr:hypothetical protein H310_03690 [Aphanomyces invadans]ETW06096.1 hypothetical protein H310_03690 [Aphanomyces invadans]|eukprot:XP_008865873.1 hypothetical protein H310_03690 [Aphanomyces invadans]